MRFLVTGAAGFVGNNLVRLLLDRGHDVRVLTRATSDPRPLAGLNVQRVEGDLLDAASLAAAVSGVDVVVNSAGWVHIGDCGWEQARRVNVDGARAVAQAAAKAGAKLVHVSSINAIGIGTKERPADETHALPQPYAPPYVVTKREGDAAVLAEVANGLWAAIVYPGFMLGPWDWKPSSGKMLLEVTKQFIPLWPVGGHSLCDVRDVCDGILAAAERGRSGERYILGGENISYRDTWRKFCALTGQKESSVPLGPIAQAVLCPAARAINFFRRTETEFNSTALLMSAQLHYASSAKAQRELGYRYRPCDDTIRDTWNWFREHGYVTGK